MAWDINKISFSGTVVADPRRFDTEKSVGITLRVAVNLAPARKGAEKVSMFYSVTLWVQESMAEDTIARYPKGTKVQVVGAELSQRSYQAKDGSTQTSLEVRADPFRDIRVSGESTPRPAAKTTADSDDLPWDD